MSRRQGRHAVNDRAKLRVARIGIYRQGLMERGSAPPVRDYILHLSYRANIESISRRSASSRRMTVRRIAASMAESTWPSTPIPTTTASSGRRSSDDASCPSASFGRISPSLASAKIQPGWATYSGLARRCSGSPSRASPADRGFRQCDAIDPANPLVAAELELRWNNALGRVAEFETRIADHVAVTPPRSETVLARK